MTKIVEIAKRHGIAVVEDAAQAHGARWNGKRVGGFGDLACFSFYPGKNLGAYGDAGAVVTNDDVLATRVRLLKNHGRDQKYIHKMEGFNSRLDNLQAAVLGVKLRHLDTWNKAREEAAGRYREMLHDVSEIRLLAPADKGQHVYHLFVVCSANRDDIRSHLGDAGVSSGVHYPVPLHLQPAYKHLGYKPGAFPKAEKLADSVLSVPMYAEITEGQQETVTDALLGAVS
jgi:dTDP-4-amino-4,6-dideoxygalactose transaminase